MQNIKEIEKEKKNNSDARFLIYMFLSGVCGFMGSVYLPPVLARIGSYLDETHYPAGQILSWLLAILYVTCYFLLVGKAIEASYEIDWTVK
ncbi:MAG: hypothetical protein JHC26_07990 [Thermofilum sp.]|jgi:hypothetical protein|uniref:hypothetical protein n=1 Tax=Thermofilum sp. TaxID=1961369 RepID=UPI00258A7C9F|nr:hypothetical protein [Thermofilum sp.]MCI4409018.1 hypothetical protein [Thermofilum sp.]